MHLRDMGRFLSGPNFGVQRLRVSIDLSHDNTQGRLNTQQKSEIDDAILKMKSALNLIIPSAAARPYAALTDLRRTLAATVLDDNF